MDNHCHPVVETPEGSLSKGMKEIADYLHLHYATVSRAVKRTGKRNI
jgi:DNA-binding MarR family transcriptional regulator